MHEKSPGAAGLNKFCAGNDKIGVGAFSHVSDDESMNRNAIQLTCWRARVDDAGSTSVATEAGKSANSLTWLKELQPLLT